MNFKTIQTRREKSEKLSSDILKLVKDRAVNKFSCSTPADELAFTVGYISSMLAQVAASSPTALATLESHFKFMTENK